MDMCWMLVVGLVVSGVGVGFDGVKIVIVVFIGKYLVVVVKVWVNWCQILIFFMLVVIVSIGLLDFYQCIFYWLVEFIVYVIVDDDLFVDRQVFFGIVQDQVIIQRVEVVVVKYWVGDF